MIQRIGLKDKANSGRGASRKFFQYRFTTSFIISFFGLSCIWESFMKSGMSLLFVFIKVEISL